MSYEQTDLDVIAEVRRVAQDFLEQRGVMVQEEEIKIVWASKVLQNWKAMIITRFAPDLYYEITHNGDANSTYVDVYKKLSNHEVLNDRKTHIKY